MNNSLTSSSHLAGIALALSLVATTGIWTTIAAAEEQTPTTSTSQSLSIEQERLATVGKHHYNSPAERAQDDLLITEVKSALSTNGVTQGHEVEVDCDHGKIRLSGTVDSAVDAKHAEQIAAAVQGVSGVDNRLIWR